jgi:hypothetical protein
LYKELTGLGSGDGAVLELENFWPAGVIDHGCTHGGHFGGVGWYRINDGRGFEQENENEESGDWRLFDEVRNEGQWKKLSRQWLVDIMKEA